MFLTTWVPFHQDIGKMKQCSQENYEPVMMGEYTDGFATRRGNL
jgi:hypothetical protein